MRRILALTLALLAAYAPANAQDRSQIGTGRLFTNDFFGDGDDRWRTGSFVYSHVRARAPYSGDEAFGDLIELRFHSQIIAPDAGTPAPGDRPYVGAASLGAHTYFGYGAATIGLGADLVAIGPQTGLSSFQSEFHDAFDIPQVQHTDDQLGDRILLNGAASVTWLHNLGGAAQFRPFVEALAGTEDLIRLGADVVIGPIGQGNLLLRDTVTGQLYTGTEQVASGVSFVLGADIASVFDSEFLPQERGYSALETRARARGGVHWQLAERASLFYGATYLGPEFSGQEDGQIVGSLKLNFNF